MNRFRNKTGVASPSRRRFLVTLGAAVTLPCWLGRGAEPGVSADELEKILAALPQRAWSVPRKRRHLLIFERNVNYGGHRSISTATTAFRLMGEKTGAFAVTSGSDPELFRADNLQKFDGVFFNNNVGNLFTDATLRENLAEFVYAGGGLMGVHGSTVAFTQWPGAIEDWPEFGLMIGARGANHRENTERVVMKIEEPGHPLVRAFSGTHFEYRDEFFRVHEPYSRKRLRVLLSMDLERMPPAQGPAYGQVERADRDYAVAWARQYGRGRCFYCTIAHNPYVFWEPVLLSFYLAAAQFILGDLPAPVTPSARLTPAIRAFEKRGWRLGLRGGGEGSVFSALEKAERLGLLHVSVGTLQQVDSNKPDLFDARLAPELRRQVRFKTDATGVRLLACEVPELPDNQQSAEAIFGFARKMGCELLAVPASKVRDLSVAGRCAHSHEVCLAVRPDSVRPLEQALALCRSAPPEVGVWWDGSYGLARKISLSRAVEALRSRLLAVEFGSGQQAVECLNALHAFKVQPLMLAASMNEATEKTIKACERVVTKWLP